MTSLCTAVADVRRPVGKAADFRFESVAGRITETASGTTPSKWIALICSKCAGFWNIAIIPVHTDIAAFVKNLDSLVFHLTTHSGTIFANRFCNL